MSETPTIYLIEDDPIMAECIARAVTAPPAQSNPQETDHRSFFCKIFPDAISAMSEIERKLPDLILLDILLSGPDGFTLLNELGSYADTAEIPIIIVTSLNLSLRDLPHYNVAAVLDKSAMTPALIQKSVRDAL